MACILMSCLRGHTLRAVPLISRASVLQWMMATYFELTSLARVKFPPHEPYIVAKYECAPLNDAQLRYFISTLDRPSARFSVVTAVCGV